MELKLPQVTVCPPKNTFTSLNYDIAKSSNKTLTLTEDVRKELADFALERIQDAKFKEIMEKEFEDEIFYNWYQGKVQIQITSEEDDGPSDESFGEKSDSLHPFLKESRTKSFIKYLFKTV